MRYKRKNIMRITFYILSLSTFELHGLRIIKFYQ